MGSRRNILKTTLCVLLVAAMACGLYYFSSSYENADVEPHRSELSGDSVRYKRIEYNGKSYVRKPDITLMLLMGVDKEGLQEQTGYRSGGQSDFIMLVVIDDDARTIRRLQIDRDTMTNITILGVLGQNVGTRYAQICLSHAFGKTPEDNCMYTIEAVENLLEGEDIEYYMAMDLEGIGKFNDVLGGVTVTVNTDMTHLDPALYNGATVCLNAQQAEYFVRSRYYIDNGTNEKRMTRQRIYMEAAFDTLVDNIKKDLNYVNTLLDYMAENIVTNISESQFANELNIAYAYDLLPVESLPGEYSIGTSGYMEFYVNDGAAAAWVIDALYRPE